MINKKLFRLFILVIFCWQAPNVYADTLQPRSKFQIIKQQKMLLSKFFTMTDLTDENKKNIHTIIIFGSNEIDVVRHAAKEFLKIYRPGEYYNIIFTGGIASDTLKLYQSKYVQRRKNKYGFVTMYNLSVTKKLFSGDVTTFQKIEGKQIVGKYKSNKEYLSEAEIFADMFLNLLYKKNILFNNIITSYSKNPIMFQRKKMKKMLSDFDMTIQIIIENNSISTSDNMLKIKEMLDKFDLKFYGDVLLIQKPLVQRRAFLSARKYFKSVKFLNSTFTKKFSLYDIVLEINKIINFGDKGIIYCMEIPSQLREANRILKSV